MPSNDIKQTLNNVRKLSNEKDILQHTMEMRAQIKRLYADFKRVHPNPDIAKGLMLSAVLSTIESIKYE